MYAGVVQSVDLGRSLLGGLCVVAASIYFPAGWLEETSSEAQKPPGAVSQLQTVVPAGLERS